MRTLLSFPTRPLPRPGRAAHFHDLALQSLAGRQLLTAVAVRSGIVSWWTGNETAADSVGPNAGTVSGGVTYAPGEVAALRQTVRSNFH
jgi:hypothetical protein